MNSIQRLAVLGLSVFSIAAMAQEPVPGNPPAVTSQSTTTTTVQDSISPIPPAPMTKREMKAQRKRQKLEEKSADAQAKSSKATANALKQENKSTNAAEKANASQ
jgi:hypothetical protein